MKNYNVSDEPVTEVAVDINDIKDTSKEKGRNEECVFLVAGRMIYRKGLDFLFDALMRFETAKGVFRVTLPNRNEDQEAEGKAV